MKRNLNFITLLFLASISYAQEQNFYPQIEQSENVEIKTELARNWNLSVHQVENFLLLQKQYQGLLSSQLSPVEWLGIFAESEEDRIYFAELLASRQLEVIEGIINFEAAYIDAIKKLSLSRSRSSQTDEKILLVTSFECQTDSCRNDLNSALSFVNNGKQIVIVVKGAQSHSQLRQWLSTTRISSDQINSNLITLRLARERFSQIPNGIYLTN